MQRTSHKPKHRMGLVTDEDEIAGHLEWIFGTARERREQTGAAVSPTMVLYWDDKPHPEVINLGTLFRPEIPDGAADGTVRSIIRSQRPDLAYIVFECAIGPTEAASLPSGISAEEAVTTQGFRRMLLVLVEGRMIHRTWVAEVLPDGILGEEVEVGAADDEVEVRDGQFRGLFEPEIEA